MFKGGSVCQQKQQKKVTNKKVVDKKEEVKAVKPVEEKKSGK